MMVQFGLGGMGISLLYILLSLPDNTASLPFPPAVFYDHDNIEEQNVAHYHIARLLQPRVVIRPGMAKVEFAAQVARVLRGGQGIHVVGPDSVQEVDRIISRSPRALIFVRQKATLETVKLYDKYNPKVIEVTDDPQMLAVTGLHLHVARVGNLFVYDMFVGAREPVPQTDVNCPQAAFILATMAADGVICYLQEQEIKRSGVLLGVPAEQYWRGNKWEK